MVQPVDDEAQPPAQQQSRGQAGGILSYHQQLPHSSRCGAPLLQACVDVQTGGRAGMSGAASHSFGEGTCALVSGKGMARR